MSIWRKAVTGLVALFAVLLVHTVSVELGHPAPTGPVATSAAASLGETPPVSPAPHGSPSCPGSRGSHDPVSPDEARSAAAAAPAQQEPASPISVVPAVSDVSSSLTFGVRSLPPAGESSSLWVDLCVMRL